MRFLLLLLTVSALAEDRVLIENSSSRYEIVSAADANPATMLAARELRTWIKQSTGVELPLISAAAPERHDFSAPVPI